MIWLSVISLSSDNAKIADLVSCTIVLEQVANAFATSSVLILTVAWMHTVDVFAITWFDHLVIRVREITERSIDRIEWDSCLHKLVVEIVSNCISRSWLKLVDLRFERKTIFTLLSQYFLIFIVSLVVTVFWIKAIFRRFFSIIIA